MLFIVRPYGLTSCETDRRERTERRAFFSVERTPFICRHNRTPFYSEPVLTVIFIFLGRTSTLHVLTVVWISPELLASTVFLSVSFLFVSLFPETKTASFRLSRGQVVLSSLVTWLVQQRKRERRCSCGMKNSLASPFVFPWHFPGKSLRFLFFFHI